MRVSAFLGAAICLACASDPGGQASVVRDSLGIQIVENRQPAWGEGDEWQVTTEPMLDLGAEADRLGRFAGGEKFFWSEGNTRGLVDHPFGRYSHTLAGDGLLLHAPSDSYEMGVYALDGSLTRLIRKQHSSLRVTSADIETYRETRLSDAREFWAGLFPHITFPETMPAYRRVMLDREGNIWVEEYRRPSDDVPRWTVFTPAGRLLGTLTTPTGLWIYDIGDGYVLGRWRDELDVEHVRLYEIVKP